MPFAPPPARAIHASGAGASPAPLPVLRRSVAPPRLPPLHASRLFDVWRYSAFEARQRQRSVRPRRCWSLPAEPLPTTGHRVHVSIVFLRASTGQRMPLSLSHSKSAFLPLSPAARPPPASPREAAPSEVFLFSGAESLSLQANFHPGHTISSRGWPTEPARRLWKR